MKLFVPDTLWYEDKDGNRLPFDIDDPKTPEGAVYHAAQFPNVVRTTIERFVSKKEVNTCDHDPIWIKRTGGWIDGIKGRECQKCHGTQVVPEDEFPGDTWPEEWRADGSRPFYSTESSYSGDLVVAMLRDFTLFDAILIAANCCERCMNSLAHEYGLDWGYPEFSEGWHKSNTECPFCKDHGILFRRFYPPSTTDDERRRILFRRFWPPSEGPLWGDCLGSIEGWNGE